MVPQPLSLRVLAAYARDVGRGVVRLDHRSMDSLGVTAGDTVEVIGGRDGADAKCFPLLPSDEGQGITRIDPAIRKIIGSNLEDTVTIRNIASVPAENFAEKPAEAQPEGGGASESIEPGTAPVFTLSGSCMDFEKERPKLVDFMATLESAAHGKSRYRCFADGKKTLGWDFFMLEMDQQFVEKLRDVYPDIDKQEAGTTEERLALWMNKQLKKMKMDFHLKLKDVPQEKVKGFRLNPEHFRDKTDVEDLR
ncbi:MAG TPA: hypothetical protein VFS46_02160 [Nitrososphaera sp.]|nr:hypothetical protein [Nitrososphaera sp.]